MRLIVFSFCQQQFLFGVFVITFSFQNDRITESIKDFIEYKKKFAEASGEYTGRDSEKEFMTENEFNIIVFRFTML